MADEEDQSELVAFPARGRAEVAAGLVEAAVSAIPVAGGPVAALIEVALAPSLGRRREEWFHRMGEVLIELQERFDGFDPRSLEENEAFVSSVFQATMIAVKTHQHEKLDMLQSAILNAALEGAPSDDEQMTFLRFVDELTPAHVRLLVFLEDSATFFDTAGIAKPNLTMGGLETILQQALPEIARNQEWRDLLTNDLNIRGLASANFGVTVSGAGIWVKRTTNLGSRFLRFVTQP